MTYNAPDPGLDLLNIERIEVLRGPQGTLYGSGSMGGLVRVVSKEPDPDLFETRVSTSVSATESGSESYSAGAAVNVPLGVEGLAFRGSAEHRVRGGYIDVLRFEDGNIEEPILIPNNNRVQTDSIRGSIKAALAPNWSITIGGLYFDRRARDGDYRDFELAGSELEEFEIEGFGKVLAFDEIYEDRLKKAFGTISGDFGFATIKSTTALLNRTTDVVYDDSRQGTVAGVPQIIPFVFFEDRKIEAFEHETHITSRLGGTTDWILGLFYSDRRDNVESRQVWDGLEDDLAGLGPGVVTQEFFGDKITELALFGEGSIALSDQWRLTGGVRWFDTQVEANSFLLTFDTDGAQNAQDILPKVSVSFFPAEGHHIYGQYSEGYRLGGINLRDFIDESSDDDDIIITGEESPEDLENFRLLTFLPDSIKQYEIGYKVDLFDGQTIVQLAAYYATWSDMQTDQFSSRGFPIAGNVGDAEIWGIEAETIFRPDPTFEIRAHFSLSESKLVRVNDDFGDDVGADIGDQLPGAPRITAAITGHKEWAVSDTMILAAFARYSHVGPTPLLFESVERRPSSEINRVDAALSLILGGTQLTLSADNLTNSSANQFAFGNPFSVLDQDQGVPLRPRTFTLTITHDF